MSYTWATCQDCGTEYITTLVNAERFPRGRCRGCRHEERVASCEVPQPRVFGLELDMARWFEGLIPKKYSEQGRHHSGGPKPRQ